jgi:hypothetical protein
MFELRNEPLAKYEKLLKDINLLESYYCLISLSKISNLNLSCKFHVMLQLSNKI